MSFEHYEKIYDGYKGRGTTLRAGGAGMSLKLNKMAEPGKKYRLFVVGETALFYQWKDEPDYPAQYRTVTDALDTVHAHEAHYCLNLSSKQPEKYIRRVYKKVLWPPMLSYLGMSPVPDDWCFGIWARADKLKFAEGGYLRMKVEVYYKKDGVNRHSVALPPDEVHTIDLSEGTWDWRELKQDLYLKHDSIAHVGVWVEGANYSGSVYVERAFLTASSGENLLPGFDVPVADKELFDWTAQYLSRKEWPEFEVKLNGKVIFSGERFERCHLDSEWAIDLPADMLSGNAELEIKLISDYHEPVPYIVREVGVIEQPAGAVALIACSQIASVSGGAHVLLRTDKPNAVVKFRSPDGRLSGESEYHFAEAGLHGVRLACEKACANAAFEFSCGNVTVKGEIPQVVERGVDNVVTGTGDMIYIEQRLDYVEEYLSWYISNGVGNLLTIRPTYRWCGTRTLNPDVWKLVTRVLNEMDIHYVLMLDGRELPGISTNPDDEMLAGAGYHGRQEHERDGAAYYWGTRSGSKSDMTEQYGDMTQRAYEEAPKHTGGNHASVNFNYVGDDIYLYRDPMIPRDNREGMAKSVAALSAARFGAPRHTGPSVMFKYMFDAGYDWLGAETMYGSMEPLMAFLRGASWAHGTDSMGVHHAVQWSSSPQDAPEHFRRYRLALYVSYMQGATEINTEEGLWHLEEYYSHFHRFSAGCGGHQKQQQDFYRYVASHTRSGRFHTPMGLIHGRYDGWHAFGNSHPWGWQDKKLSEAERSWDLLKTIYPLSKPGAALYIHGCDTDHPVGYHTGTPMGNIDALPIESDVKLLENYGALAFMGYHCAEESDYEKLTEYVSRGGKLMLTRAHMTDTTWFDDVAEYKLHQAKGHPFAFCAGEPHYVENHVNGASVQVCDNAAEPTEVLARTDEGLPLVCIYALGEGQVVLFNAKAYPANAAIRPLYEQQITRLMQAETEKEPIWAETGDDVGSAVYVQDDGARHVYLLAVDWYRPESNIRTARVRVGQDKYAVEMPFGTMIKCVAKSDCVAWPHSEDGEVLSVEDGKARVQGSGVVKFTVGKAGTAREVEIDFAQAAVQEIWF